MRFLVVGASGFLGSAVLRRLRERGFEAIGTQCSRHQPGLIQFDLSRDCITRCLPPQFLGGDQPLGAIIATTARAMDDCATQQQADFVHIDRTFQVVKDLSAAGARVLFISTGYVYDGSVGYYTEADPPCPLGDYGRQKLAVETSIAKELPEATVFRLEKIISDELAGKNLFTQWVETIRSGKPIECIAGQIFAPTAAWDIADAAQLALERGMKGLFHVCNTEFFLRDELAFQFCRITGLKAAIVSKPMAEFGFADPRPLKTYLDPSKFRAATGFNFTTAREVMERFRRKCVK